MISKVGLNTKAGDAYYLWQVVSTQSGIHTHFPGSIQRNDVAHSLHLMDDSTGVGHGLSVGQAWLLPLANHSVNLSVYFFWKRRVFRLFLKIL